MPGHPLLTDSPTVPVSTLATLMAHADDLVEAELGLLAAPVPAALAAYEVAVGSGPERTRESMPR